MSAEKNTQKTAYERDFYAWANHQALLLRQKKFDEVDIENLIEEVETLGRSEHNALESRLTVLIMHLLKWKFQPEKKGSSWNRTIVEQRIRIQKLVKQSPSLKHSLKEKDLIQEIWLTAIKIASAETMLPKSTFPKNPIWTIEQILDDDFYPSSDNPNKSVNEQ